MSVNQLTKQDVIRLLPINDLLYTRTAPTNPVVERTQKKSYAEGGSGTTYTALDHLIVNLQTGTEFIDPLQSFLVFDLEIESKTATGAAWDFGFQGSAMNLVRDTQISTRSGKEMDRLEQANLLAYHTVRGMPLHYVNNNLSGLMLAHDQAAKPGNLDPQDRKVIVIPNGGTVSPKVRMMIPLKFISPIFDSEKLMPPHLARGLRIDCTMEAVKTALTAWSTLTAGEADGITYKVYKPYVLCDSYRMADTVLEFLNAEFASKDTGLVYEYFSYHTTKTTVQSSDLNVEIRRSVSMALDAYCVTRDPARKSTLLADSFASLPITDTDRSQWRIGSHYLPNVPSEGTVEHFAQMLYYLNMLRDEKQTGTTPDRFVGDNSAPTTSLMNYGEGKFTTTLQRNNILDLSGIAINNSMTLAIDAFLSAGGTRDVSVFLRHLRRAVLFLESAVLET
jgi:hypothetical protein